MNVTNQIKGCSKITSPGEGGGAENAKNADFEDEYLKNEKKF